MKLFENRGVYFFSAIFFFLEKREFMAIANAWFPRILKTVIETSNIKYMVNRTETISSSNFKKSFTIGKMAMVAPPGTEAIEKLAMTNSKANSTN